MSETKAQADLQKGDIYLGVVLGLLPLTVAAIFTLRSLPVVWPVVAAFILALAIGLIRVAARCSIRFKLAALALGYLSITVAFAVVYFLLYASEAKHFTVTSNIEEAKLFEQFDKDFKRVLATNHDLRRLAVLHAHANLGITAAQKSVRIIDPLSRVPKEESEAAWVDLKQGYRAQFQYSNIYTKAGFVETYRLEVSSPDGSTTISGTKEAFGELNPTNHAAYLAIRDMFQATDEDVFRASVDRLIESLESQRDASIAELDQSLGRNLRWNILDFWYFSVSTITTLGYGDIVPNSTTIRCVVGGQALLGVFFLAFALLFVFGDGHPRRDKAKQALEMIKILRDRGVVAPEKADALLGATDEIITALANTD